MTNIKQNRFLNILRLGGFVFRVSDLAKIWQLENRASLLITLKRYVDQGLIYRLHRGLYSVKKIEELDSVLLGFKIFNNYCYLSGETVLAKHGAIFQKINYLTFIGGGSKRISVGPYNYYFRKLKKDYLYNDFGVNKNNEVSEASLERAVADILYFNPNYHFDNLEAINWDRVREIQKIVYHKI